MNPTIDPPVFNASNEDETGELASQYEEADEEAVNSRSTINFHFALREERRRGRQRSLFLS